MSGAASELSVVIPVYNEAAIAEQAVARIRDALAGLGVPFELLLCENGSRDATPEIIARHAREDARIRQERLAVADYGQALKHAIAVARCERVVIFNLDFWDMGFVRAALELLDHHDLVLGSKVKGDDRRPVIRRLITHNFNRVLRVVFGFRGSDTHGLKAFRRAPLLAIAEQCETAGWIFDTELVIRAERAGLRIAEVPVSVAEIRAPSYGSLIRRIPQTTRNLVHLFVALRRASAAAPVPARDRAREQEKRPSL